MLAFSGVSYIVGGVTIICVLPFPGVSDIPTDHVIGSVSVMSLVLE